MTTYSKTTIWKHVILFLMMTMGTVGAWGQTEITSLSSIDTTGDYIIKDNIDASGFTTSIASFSGTLTAQAKDDGTFPVISNLKVPIFTTATDATISNIILDEVDISQDGIVGSIASTANGSTRIYNCGILSGSVGSTGGATDNPKTKNSCGGLVGLLDGTARVINCYSYATITGGNRVGGIVGYNNATTTASSINTMVMNCMFYGDITGGSKVSPVYGGNNINNLQGGLNTFNYYVYNKLKSKSINFYNCALAVEEKYLTRFEFYRQLLNSNKKLAAIYVTGNATDANIMAKWVLETADRNIVGRAPYPYPILKAQRYYPSIINPDVEHAPDSASVGRNHGGKLPSQRGTLSVTISGVGSNAPSGAIITNGSLTLTRTDKDFDRYNFNYDKVQLPYYNDVGTGNYTGNRVVTGWKITNITTVDGDPYDSSNYPTTGIKDYPDHNYADRKSSNKDLYSVSGRVFSQGAYFDVPYGVESITIEPYWGKAVYVADEKYDVVYKQDYSGKQNVSQTGTQVTVGTTKFHDQRIETSVGNALSYISNNLGGYGSTVYDNAVVLVGNLHLDGVPSGGSTPFTMMSVDEDNDHEPDYSLIYHHKSRTAIAPIRFDFLAIPGTAQAQKPNGASLICNFTIFKTKGWFECTNTAFFYTSQVEYENLDGVTKADAPLILLGGVIDQFVSTQSKAVNGKTIYIHLGGNVWIHEFGMGTHSDGSKSTPHVPVSVTGGDYDGFYLTGTYNANADVRDDNAECYISGGRFGEVAGAAQEQLGGQKDLTKSTNNGNVHWQIYNADITSFFGGGVNDAKPVQGNIITDIYNSHVGTFCGGPKFGNMYANASGTVKKTVTTNAEGCVFEKYFGAGYGGNSYSRKKYYDERTPAWGTTLQGYYTTDRGYYFDGVTTNSKNGGGTDDQYGKKGPGVATDFDYEFFVWSSGQTGGRFFVKFVSFSLATCNDVTSKLKNCHITDNFYGGGSLGEVKGKATSELDDCTVDGNVFGGGYSATLPTIEVRDGGFTKTPNYNSSSGMFEPAELSGTTTFTWKNATEAGVTLANNKSGSDLQTNHYIYTNQDLTALGKVGETDLTVKGNTYVQGIIYEYDDDGKVIEGTGKLIGGVFGGGDESAVIGNTKVDIQGTATSGTDQGINNVYGGGNTADVEGDATVFVTGGKMKDVYGGGRGSTTTVKNDVKVHIGKSFEDDGTTVALTGTPTITGDVYGGSAFGAVNASTKKDGSGNITAYTPSTDKTAIVNIYAGIVSGSVYGGGLGDSENQAKVYGDATVNIGASEVTATPTVVGSVYGGSNVNGVSESDVYVNIIRGNITGTVTDGKLTKGNVHGGGEGRQTLVKGNVTVNMGTKSTGGTPVFTGAATVNGDIYGGSAFGNVNANSASNFNTDKTTTVNLYKGTVKGNVYGGGLGQKGEGSEGDPGYVEDIPAYVGGDVTVELNNGVPNTEKGCVVEGSIFGCNNVNGSPKEDVTVHIYKTQNVVASHIVNSEDDTDEGTMPKKIGRYDVAAVYGGGNQAAYNPTDANNNKTIVEIEGCDETSINYVYGGGNAAPVPASKVTIYSCYEINYLFGGGNGAGTGNPGADVGIMDKEAYATDNETGIYGTGIASTTLVGGTINYVYGGSNTLGNVRGGTKLERTETNSCPLKIGQIYGAGQEAPMDGNVNIVLECMPEEFVDAVYGGAKNATINGNVSLTVTSGKYGRVFGGNNEGGTINGSITVNVYEDGCQPLIIGELYGGGNEAPYSVWGCNDDDNDGQWIPNAESGTPHIAADADAISVNVYSCTSIGKVFGGGMGATAQVIGNTKVWINTMQGIVDGAKRTYSTNPNVYIGKIGQVFGGGNAAPLEGRVTLDIGTATVSDSYSGEEIEKIGINIVSGTDYLAPESNTTTSITAGIYGGGYSANVDGDVKLNIGTVSQNQGINIGGNIFGGGYGEDTHVTGNVTVNIGTNVSGTPVGYATISGDVYGGSAKGKVNTIDGSAVNTYSYPNPENPSENLTADCYTQVNLYGGTISGNLYGGGLGENNEGTTNDHAADVYGPVTVNVEGGTVTDVFGCNNVLGSPQSTATVNIHGTAAPVSPATYTITSVYGGGNQAAYNGTGGVSVSMSGGYVNDVFGGGLGSSATVNGNTTVGISGGSVINNVYGGGNEAHTNGGTSVTLSGTAAIGNDVYGGGSLAKVQGAVTLALNGGIVARDVYGGGALAETNTEYLAGDATKGDYITTVNLGDRNLSGIVRGTTIRGDLYGGGLGRLASGDDAAIAANVNGPVTVNVDGGLVTNVFGCNNINGTPESTVTVNIKGSADPTFEIALPIHNVYGGGNQAAYTFADDAHPQNLQVNISGGTMGNVFGGGLSADVVGGIDVKVTGGTIIDDVYGGGALANTNTGNWDATNNTWNVPAATPTVYYEKVKHLKTGDDVSSFYTESGGIYSQASNPYNENTDYYKQLSFNPNVYNIAKADGHTTYKTSVLLTGGTVGNAYGGGLGQLYKAEVPAVGTEGQQGYTPTIPEVPAVEAMVYGDVEVTVNGTAFTDDVEYINGTSENVPKHGRVFGCNNLNGTPKGKVTVTVLATKRTDGSSNHVKGELEIQGVYGGGNLANYVPETYDKTDDNDHTGQTEFGQKTSVIIDGCSNVSINKVYGGGNAASVPISDVTIEGAFEIGYVFGGGNGGDKVNYGSGWVTNPGADVTHYANVMLKGGTIGQAFGGSDTRGTCGGTDVKQSTSPDCPLRIVNLYGAGNGEEATSDSDVNVEVSACGEGSEIQNVFGGSYKANIKGAVNLTIKSGIFTSVYGGNDRMGSIGGNITVNIEETDNCSKPIIIQNLYGGCYQTAYPGPNAQYKDGNGVLQPFTSGNITVNVKSATRIDRIFGGSENGAVTGNTTVNINMVAGSQSNKTDVALPSYYGETGAQIPSNITVTDTDGYIEVNGLVTEQAAEADHTKEASSVVGYYTKSGDTYSVATGYAQDNVTYYKKAVKGNIAPGIGTIGKVYGGGNRGNVSGDAAVNIVTEESVNMVSLSNASRTVLGAKIDGNVYGGGNLANVDGNTDVNICVKKNDSDVYEALSEGTEHVTIGGNIYGGGKGDDDTFECEKGMVGVVNTNDGSYAAVDKGTHVRIGNGTIGTTLQNGTLKAGTGNVYGGGEVGRVEYHSVVTIGLTPKTGVASSAPEILGNVFGGGQGVETHGYSALLRGNTTVTVQQNAKVRNSVYGGGELGTIGRFFVRNVNDASYEHKNDPEYASIPTGMPYALRDGGKCTVNILDNVEIGPTARMTMPTFAGNVFGGGKGVIPKVYDYSADDDEHKPRRISVGNVKDYFKNNDAYLFFIETLALDDETYVTIGDNAFIKGSVYGGSENGRVLNDTHVTIAGGQIGWGKNAEGRHPAAVWDNDTPTTDLECPSWTYDKNDAAPYDPFAHTDAATYDYTLSNFSIIPQAQRLTSSEGGKRIGKDGHTYYGNVFGGGSGKDPYAPGKWHRKGGAVGGNATVNITGGHILTNIYGGNEFTDVGTYGSDGLTPVSGGKCTVNMTGGTLGVPRTVQQMSDHPVTCYLFGAGKGDQRIFFNTWTNVISTEVNITGTARIYGSTFGGGEDGHVLGNAVTNIGGSVEIDGTTYTNTNVKIGTTGTSYVDGNVFGGGRGFSGEALTAGSTGGNADVTISGGTMLGSVYGGGRLASIGIGFTSPDDDSYGQLTDDTSDSDVTHGRIRVTISGGTIGNDVEGAQYGGNVFGAGMGRNTLLNGSLNPLWPKVATSKTTTVNISGGTIKKNVYGGAEFGVVRNQATVTISGTADIKGSVYGGGKGSDDYQHLTPIKVGGYDNLYYSFTPMLWNGVVAGNTIVNINGGTVGMNVYGGGELASVGLIDFVSDENGNFTNMPKHTSLTDGFGLSWPYKFTYHAAAPNDDAPGGKDIGGKATVTITGGHIGSSTWNDGTGYVFGGGKGKVEFGITSISDQRYTEAFCANVRETEVKINYGSTPIDKNSSNIGAEANCIMGAVYGGGEDGHVYENANVTISNGLIGLSVYGAGKGISMYKGYLRDQSTNNFKNTTDDLYSWTAGKVYGNATITMTNGHVLNNVYGGGYLGSVGKGNYAGGADDYYKEGYGETLQGNLWASTTEGDNAWQFLNSGKATVEIAGGTIGTLNGTYGNVGGSTDPTPSGMVFGGSRGQSAEDVMLDPRYEYAPNFYLGYVNNTEVTIGTTEGGAPRIYSQVFGGGRDGHVRGNAHVIVNNGIIGQTYTETKAVAGSTADYQRYHRGNVYGSGSGLGQWTTGKHGMSSGSVTRNTTVDINGGTIYNNVYGGGALSSVGPPRLDPEKDYAPADWSKCVVNINGGTIGDPTVYDEHEYGGCVYGASRGNDFATDESPDNFATVLWTQVNINDGNIAGNVYGGAKGGLVWKDTEVNLKGGRVYHDAYGGGQGTTTPNIAANVGGTTVELNKNVATTDKGCIVERIFGCNDLNGTPRGHVKVHVHATQNTATSNISTKIAPATYSTKKGSNEGYLVYLRRILDEAYKKENGTIIEPRELVSDRIVQDTITRVEAFYSLKNAIGESNLSKDEQAAITTAAINVIKQIEEQHDYDVKAVYGGGNLAPYEPYGPDANNTEADFKATTENTEVIIEGCDVTSIKQVYGGGNAASVPATDVSVKSVFVIDELFGGGNGLDHYSINDKWYQNPGANVGYTMMAEYDTSGSHGTGADNDIYVAIPLEHTSEKDDRIQYYSYGTGYATTTVTGGHIHTVYGGSNEKGNIRTVALSTYQKSGACPLVTDESYGGSKTATMDAEIQVVMDCVEDGGIYFGGSQNADINNNVTINITNGSYLKVYGGNNKAGTINGAITINIEEKGCSPIEIGELYGGGLKAPYSVYGYQKDSNGKFVTVDDPVETDDEGNPIKNRIPLKRGDAGALATPHRDPYINIISATSIGTIYGGGDQALVVGSPHVNVNMQKGIILEEYAKELAGYSSLTLDNGGIDADGNKILPVGTIGSIYGGGNLADVIGNTYVDIGTGSWFNYKTGMTETIDRNAAIITGNVFGGGKGEATDTGDDAFTCAKAMVGRDGGGVTDSEGNTNVVIGNGTVGTTMEDGSLKAGTGNVYGGGEIGRVENNTSVTIGIEGNTTNELTIGGNVFGASQGVITHGYSGLSRGNSTVIIQGKAKVLGSVYGGGEMATVGKYVVDNGVPTTPDGGGLCTVTVRDNAEIGPDDMTMTATGGPDDFGHVFGAGKGAVPGDYTFADDDHRPWRVLKTDDHPNGTKLYLADEAAYLKHIETLGLAANTNVTIGGNAFVKGSVYGGAENGYVQADTHVTIEGNCQIGNGYVQMDNSGNYLDSPLSMNRPYSEAEWEQRKLIMGDKDRDALKALVSTTNYNENSLPECASWKYQSPYFTYDKFADTPGYDPKDGAVIASNGHTFYGNVFGGGSGYYPYKAGEWHFKAGSVGGNTVVDITGGHILTNIYGGNEMTNVSGNCTINMSGGTLGVPRTLGQIAKHPVTCDLFGGGKGDARVFFNKQTNVQNVTVNITGGWVYCSVFGGGEDGHVQRNVTMNINGGTTVASPTYADYYAGRATKIGTWGTSYVDGNIFGGGRGFEGDAYTAGNVAGSVTMTINGGEILGSVYGGGRLGSVGYGLYAENETETPSGDKMYGMMQDDGYDDWYKNNNNEYVRNAIANFKRGYIDITINGGTIGNSHEYVFVPTGTTEAGLETLKTDNYMPNTEFVFDKDLNFYRLSHTKGGNVFAGGMGRMTQLDGSTPISVVDWWKLGNVKSTKLTINGGTIKSNVYGGGELGMVQGTHTSVDNKTVSTEITINGGTIGTVIQETIPGANEGDPSTTETRYTFGSVFGAGYGSITEKLSHTRNNQTYETYPKYIAGRVKGSTEVTMTGGEVKASVYGGGEMASVGESKVLATQHITSASDPVPDPVVLGETLTGANGAAMDGHTYVTVSGGTIGIPKDGDRQFGGGTMGNVYGGGSGYINTVRSGQIYGNTNVNISQAEGKTTRIYHNIYGGGAYGTVGDFTYVMTLEGETKKVTNMGGLHSDRTGTGTATVTITGGEIGVDGHENGMVFGSSRGEVDEPNKRPDWLAWVNAANVTIGTAANGTGGGGSGAVYNTPLIKGSIYGSGENGHTYQNTLVNIHNGTIGNTTEYYKYRGNVYGSGCGTDTYTKDGKEHYNPTAGIVRGNATVNIDGGLIAGNVYGAGAMASVGTVTSETKHEDINNSFALSWPYEFEFADNTGKATINITGGHIGINDTDGGDVFGSTRGEAGDRYTMAHYAYVKEAEVIVRLPRTAEPSGLDSLETPCITGSVHGSGDNGYVYGDTHVTLHRGLIAHSLYGGGKGKGQYELELDKITTATVTTNNTPEKEVTPPSQTETKYTANVYGLLSGKVLGNTYVTMNDGHVMRNVYGGGNMGSVGKGNYSGGTDDYYPSGYGETLATTLWDKGNANSLAFWNSGKTNVRVLGGKVGYVDADPSNSIKNNLPYGNVIGGSAGEAAANIYNDPRYQYCPAFFSGYVNETNVVIGGYRCKKACKDNNNVEHAVDEIKAEDELLQIFDGTDVLVNGKPNSEYWEIAPTGPEILGSVYGGGQDGHVRRDTKVTVNAGEIGLPFTKENRQDVLKTWVSGEASEELDNDQWLHRGNVYGGGSGISEYKYDFNYDGDYVDVVNYGATAETKVSTKETYLSTSAGSVARFTEVNIKGGTIHRNVYGGGSLGSVGAPLVDQDYLPNKKGDSSNGRGEGKQSQCFVTIGGEGQVYIGKATDYQQHYGGEVYGACRGLSSDNSSIATSIWTKVLIKAGANILGNVFGGGDAGMVKKDTDVQIGEKKEP